VWRFPSKFRLASADSCRIVVLGDRMAARLQRQLTPDPAEAFVREGTWTPITDDGVSTPSPTAFAESPVNSESSGGEVSHQSGIGGGLHVSDHASHVMKKMRVS
jgi:hypothetical protein